MLSASSAQLADTKIAFESRRSIHVMNVDGTNLIDLTNAPYNARPAWSPDGTKIAFASDRDKQLIPIPDRTVTNSFPRARDRQVNFSLCNKLIETWY